MSGEEIVGDGVTGDAGDYAHLVLTWGPETLRVAPDGDLDQRG